ncbi:hypothetical protein MH215_10130 [Paenibacillus sp. ACRSA]|uniref:hypothetical protein n=1 Tax=Paenibacillus sp. ACRSA TaxID=2918211 RepID=UPI001EF4751A|nr:hypothetical protein [Paenibacillus sp. ACRSA]MCG7377353.1 hypothetical protein [Paenibacillus sp. ACRSA]
MEIDEIKYVGSYTHPRQKKITIKVVAMLIENIWYEVDIIQNPLDSEILDLIAIYHKDDQPLCKCHDAGAYCPIMNELKDQVVDWLATNDKTRLHFLLN